MQESKIPGAVALAIADAIARPTSKHAEWIVGSEPIQDESWDVYSKKWHRMHGPARYLLPAVEPGFGVITLRKRSGAGKKVKVQSEPSPLGDGWQRYTAAGHAYHYSVSSAHRCYTDWEIKQPIERSIGSEGERKHLRGMIGAEDYLRECSVRAARTGDQRLVIEARRWDREEWTERLDRWMDPEAKIMAHLACERERGKFARWHRRFLTGHARGVEVRRVKNELARRRNVRRENENERKRQREAILRARSSRRSSPERLAEELKAAIAIRTLKRKARENKPMVGATRDDGALLGVRTFAVDPTGYLLSPSIGTVWERSALTAPQWEDGSAVRGVCGIHACWPGRLGSLPDGHDAPIGSMLVTAEVIGWGRTVQGDLGWRAEHVMITRVHAPSHAIAALRSRYPEIEVIERKENS